MPSPSFDRAAWIERLVRVATPILSAAAEHRLIRDMPVEVSAEVSGKPKVAAADRARFSHLEALARTLMGVAPFLELAADGEARRLVPTALEAIVNCFDPASPDRLDFAAGHQVIVDAAFLAEAFLRSPKVLWAGLDAATQDRVVAAFKSLRTKAPAYNNWLLFASTTEAFLETLGRTDGKSEADPMRVEFALRQHEQWYVGGGWYKDGPSFHHDYYNSFVIHPMLLETAEAFAGRMPWVASMLPEWKSRARRHGETLERFIAPNGSYPVTGRSIAYRCGAFHLLAYLALYKDLPDSLPPAQVRVALHSVITRTLSDPSTFDPNGFLTIGLSAHQPALGEAYISTGSLYLCAAAFLPLGLPPTDPFWTAPDSPTTWTKAWSGVNMAADHD